MAPPHPLLHPRAAPAEVGPRDPSQAIYRTLTDSCHGPGMTSILPLTVSAICFGAAAVYAWYGDYRSCLVWGGFALADLALGWPR